MQAVNTVMIGVGNISDAYLQNITGRFRAINLIGVCDLIRERAEKAQAKYSIPKIYDTMEDAFADPEVELVLNLTRPYQHFAVSKAALEAGKNVYSEKPLGASLEEGIALRDLAVSKGLFLGGAPDTFLGAGLQTCRKLIDQGFIGQPIGSAAFMIGHGAESWHPDPDFFYHYGGGPMFDMGPYYLTAMINMMGPIDEVMSASRCTFKERMITSEPHFGTPIYPDVNTYIAGTVKYASGAIGTIFTTFDVYYPQSARLEIYGTEGTLFCPDPNHFDGPVKLFRPEYGEAREIPLCFDYRDGCRGIGLADAATSIRTGRRPRTSWKQTFHVLDAITGFDRSAQTGQWIKLQEGFQREAPMRKPVLPGVLEED